MSVELLRSVKQFGISTKLMNTGKAININQLITGTRVYEKKNITLGISPTFASNFSEVMNSDLSFLVSFAYRLF